MKISLVSSRGTSAAGLLRKALTFHAKAETNRDPLIPGTRTHLKQAEVVQIGDVLVDQYRRVVWNVLVSTDFGVANCGVEYLGGSDSAAKWFSGW